MTAHGLVSASEQTLLRMRLKDFLLLEESGAFDRYAKAELLDGEIWVVNAIHSPHAAAQAELHGLLWVAVNALQAGVRTYLTPAVEVSDVSLPEPDIVIAEPHGQGFLPLGKVSLMVEVSDTTLKTDLGRKQRIYAAAGVPEYWVADVNARVLHQMWAPQGEAYAERREVAFGERVAAATIAGLAVDTCSL